MQIGIFSKYALVASGCVPASTITSLNRGRNVTVATIDRLCNCLGCGPGDILSFTPDTVGEAETVSGRMVMVRNELHPPKGCKETGTADCPANKMMAGVPTAAAGSVTGNRETSDPELSDSLEALLRDRGWNASDLARAAGLTRSTVSNIVHGHRRNPRYETLLAIADALEVPVDDLLRGHA